MRLAAQERRREGNEPQTTKVAHHTTYPRHEGFEVEIKDEDADAVGASPESSEVVEFGVMPAVSRLQPSDVGLDGVGGAAGGVSGGQGMEVEVMEDTVLRTQVPQKAVYVLVTEEVLGPEYVVNKSWCVMLLLVYLHRRLEHVYVDLGKGCPEIVEVPAGWQPTDDACMALAKSFVEKLKKDKK